MGEFVKSATAGIVSATLPYVLILGTIAAFLIWYRDPISKGVEDITKEAGFIVDDASRAVKTTTHTVLPSTDPETVKNIIRDAIGTTDPAAFGYIPTGTQLLTKREGAALTMRLRDMGVDEPTEAELDIYAKWQTEQIALQNNIDKARFQGY